jgi:hypothetical protein
MYRSILDAARETLTRLTRMHHPEALQTYGRNPMSTCREMEETRKLIRKVFSFTNKIVTFNLPLGSGACRSRDPFRNHHATTRWPSESMVEIRSQLIEEWKRQGYWLAETVTVTFAKKTPTRW